MADSIVERTVHERHIGRRFSSKEHEALLVDVVRREAGIPANAALQVKVRFESETEGSPPYQTGIRVVVDVVQQLGDVAEEAIRSTAPGAFARAVAKGACQHF